MHKPVGQRTILIAVVISALLTLVLALDLTPWLRGGAGWRWPYAPPHDLARLLPGLLVLALYVFVALPWLANLERKPERSALAFGLTCALGGVALQLAFLSFYDANPVRQLFVRTVSTSSGGFHEVGVRVEDVSAFLRDFPDLMPGFSVHPKAHPPGIPLLFWLATRGFGALPPLADALAAWLRPYQCQQTVIMSLPDAAIAGALPGMALPALGMLALWPLYKLARLLYNRAVALRAVMWWPLVPALVVFVPQWNQLHPFFALLALWLLVRGLRDWRWQDFALAGGVMSVATYLSFTNVMILGLLGAFVAAWVALALRRGAWSRDDWPRLALRLAAFAGGLASLWVVYYLATGVTFFEVLGISLTTHYDLGHPYLPWTLLLPLDLWLFGGLVLGALAAIEAARSWRSGDALALATGLSVVGLAVSGVLRGEVGRLLLWLMPFVVLLAARAASRERGATRPVILALAAQLVVVVAFLHVIDTELSLPPVAPPGVAMAGNPADATFDGAARVVAFDGQPASGASALDVNLTWQALSRFDHPQYAGVIVVGPDGETLGVQDWLAGSEAYPTSCWRPGQQVNDSVRVPLDATPPGDYWLSLRLYDAVSGDPLPASVPGQPPDTQVGLGPFQVP